MRDANATWEPSPNFDTGRPAGPPRWIILHGTAGPGAVSWFQNPASQVSAHYVITRDGMIHCCVDENDWAWANGVESAGHASWWTASTNPNWVTISIEHEKYDASNASDLTPAQYAASYALQKRICQRWNIPMRQADASGGITGHFSVDPVNRSACPGTYNWSGLWAYFSQPGATQSGDDDVAVSFDDPVMKTYFKFISSGKWQCLHNGFYIGGAIAAWYCRYGGVAVFGLPISNELTNVVSGCVVQIFERGIVIYDPITNGKRKFDNPPTTEACYLIHLDPGSRGQALIAASLVTPLQDDVNKLTTDNKALQAEVAGSQEAKLTAAMHSIYTTAAGFEAK